MKAGWRTRKLGDVLEVQNGYAFDSKEFNPSRGMPLIRIRSLKAGVETETRYSGDYDEKYVVKAGDLLVGMDGEFGCYEWKGSPALLNQRVCRLQGFGSELVPRFLFYGINSHLKAIEDVTGFATVKHLSSKQILSIEFPLPPFAEQQHIVGLLDQAFDGIATAKANAEKNLQNARALFESSLQSIFTRCGEGWAEKPLEDVTAIVNGFAFKSGDFSPSGEAKCIKITNVGVREFVCESGGGLPKEFSNKFASVAIPAGSIVIALTRTIISSGLKVAVVPSGYDGALLNQRVAAILPRKGGVSLPFLYAYLSSQEVANYVTQRVNTLMQPNLSIVDLRSMPVPVPPIQQQGEITGLLSSLADETHRLESIYQQRLAALNDLKESLLHQAFSGQLTERSVEAAAA